MSPLDQGIIAAYLLTALSIGLIVTKQASRSTEEFFVAGRSLPWWLAGTSMVATTFAADTPLAVTGLVASGGIAGNWLWWSWGIAHVVAAVVFSRWWRKLEVVTDVELIELRYSGRPAAVLRVVQAGYRAIFLNCLTMGWVILAMRKLASNLFPSQDPALITFVLMGIAVFYSLLGGLRSVVWTDLIQFCLAMMGAGLLLFHVLRAPEIGGLSGLVNGLERTHPDQVGSLLSFFPEGDLPGLPMGLFAVLLTVAWWRQAEGSGYIVQRLSAARSPADAERASLWFAFLHNAIRPWPWILVALAALVLWPLGSVEPAGPCASGPLACATNYVCSDGICVFDREATYAILLVERLPSGALGLAVVSLLAAFMSTIDTHVNWGASYLVQDVWRRFIRPKAEPRSLVLVGRSGVILMGFAAAFVSLFMDSVVQVWLFVITLGSGLGGVSIARWFWWRVNAMAEIAALATATVLALLVVLQGAALPKASGILLVALGTPMVWIPVALLTKPTEPSRLRDFCMRVRPAGAWGDLMSDGRTSIPARTLGRVLMGLTAVYGGLFGLGGLLLRPDPLPWAVLLGIAIACLAALFRPTTEAHGP